MDCIDQTSKLFDQTSAVGSVLKPLSKPCGIGTLGSKMEASKLLKEKRFWFASVLIAWAAGLQVSPSLLPILNPNSIDLMAN